MAEFSYYKEASRFASEALGFIVPLLEGEECWLYHHQAQVLMREVLNYCELAKRPGDVQLMTRVRRALGEAEPAG